MATPGNNPRNNGLEHYPSDEIS